MGYFIFMDVLGNIEIGLDRLLARLDMLKNDNTRLREEICAIAQDNSMLIQENQNLRSRLDDEVALRELALQRIDALLFKVQTYAKVENFSSESDTNIS